MPFTALWDGHINFGRARLERMAVVIEPSLARQCKVSRDFAGHDTLMVILSSLVNTLILWAATQPFRLNVARAASTSVRKSDEVIRLVRSKGTDICCWSPPVSFVTLVGSSGICKPAFEAPLHLLASRFDT